MPSCACTIHAWCLTHPSIHDISLFGIDMFVVPFVFAYAFLFWFLFYLLLHVLFYSLYTFAFAVSFTCLPLCLRHLCPLIWFPSWNSLTENLKPCAPPTINHLPVPSPSYYLYLPILLHCGSLTIPTPPHYSFFYSSLPTINSLLFNSPLSVCVVLVSIILLIPLWFLVLFILHFSFCLFCVCRDILAFLHDRHFCFCFLVYVALPLFLDIFMLLHFITTLTVPTSLYLWTI